MTRTASASTNCRASLSRCSAARDLAEDARHPIDGRFSGITIAVNQRSEADVDAVLAQAEAAGGTVLKAAEHTEWGGYSGYFADLDGHVWEIAVNPAWTINADGTLTI